LMAKTEKVATAAARTVFWFMVVGLFTRGGAKGAPHYPALQQL